MGTNWKYKSECLEAKLGMYKRAFCRLHCKDLYTSGARWEVKKHENFENNNLASVVEVVGPDGPKTRLALLNAFYFDDAEEIAFLLNRATDELLGNSEKLEVDHCNNHFKTHHK